MTETMERAAEDTYTRVGDPDAVNADRGLIAEGLAGLLQRAQRDTKATVWRLRRQALPHAVTGAVLGGGLAAEAVCASGGASPGTVAAGIAATTFPIAAGVAAWVRKRRPRWARRVLLGGLLSAAWLTMAPFGVTPGDAGVLLAGEYALAARWWQLNRLGYPGPTLPEEEEPAEGEPTLAEQIIADWNTYVACVGGPLPESRLCNPEVTPHTIAFDLMLWRGRQTFTTAVSALEKIAGGLGRNISALIIEPDPAAPEESSEARCRFQVVTNSPIRGNVDFTGPRRRGGLLDLGPYADGSGEAPWRLYTPGSMWSGVIIGGTGIGKSRVVENIVISAVSGGDTEFWYLDPNRGGSSPALAKHADWFVTMDNADDMLAAGIAALDGRAEENAAEGWTGFTPSPQRPGLLIIVEECHNPFSNKKAAVQWARIAREGRKVGIALLCISQYSGIVTFGNVEPLRSNVMEGNAIALRTTSNSAGQLMPGLMVDPKTLPKIPGYAYVQGSEETGNRTAPFRNRNTLVPDDDAPGEWLKAQPRPGLDRLTTTATLAAGAAYQDRNITSNTGRDAASARVKELREGRLPAGFGAASQRQAEQQEQVGEMGVIVEFPQPLTLADLAEPATPTAAALELGDSHRTVLAAVAVGKSRPVEIEQATGLSHRRVAELLKELVVAGHLIQPKYGRYERAA